MSLRRFLHSTCCSLAKLSAWVGALCAFTACGDYFEYAIVPTTMTLEQHSMTLMVGDSAVIRPVFTPDSLSNNTIYCYSMDNSVASFISADTIVAHALGETQAVAIAVIDYTRADTCNISVISRWDLHEKIYPYETVVYASLSVAGQPVTDYSDITVAAFVGKELRGVGHVLQARGITYVAIRIGSELDPYSDYSDYVDPDGETPPELYREPITFRCYDHRHHILLTCPKQLTFDGEAHGTLSDLYPISF